MARHKFLFPFVLLLIGIFSIFVAGVFRLMHNGWSPYFFYGGIGALLLSIVLFVIIKLKEE